MHMSTTFVPIATFSSGVEDFTDIHRQLPAEWLAERTMWAKIAGLSAWGGEHNITVGRDRVAEMVTSGHLERRVAGSQVQYRPAPEPPLPPEPLTALQAQRLRDERRARTQREVEDREIQQRERVREEHARPIIEAQDREFTERFERLLGPRLDALEARLDALEARLDALEARLDALEARA
jgi:hypothetical protein